MCCPFFASVQTPLAQISDADEPLMDNSAEVLPFLGSVARTICAPFHMLISVAPAANTVSAFLIAEPLVNAFLESLRRRDAISSRGLPVRS
jgi:hypothetical protein